MMLVRVEAPHFTAGLLVSDLSGRCVKAAPTLRWALGQQREALSQELRRRGWKATVVPEDVQQRWADGMEAAREGRHAPFPTLPGQDWEP
jgi:hypothetical protein